MVLQRPGESSVGSHPVVWTCAGEYSASGSARCSCIYSKLCRPALPRTPTRPCPLTVLTGWPSLSRQVIVGDWLISGGGRRPHPPTKMASHSGTADSATFLLSKRLPQNSSRRAAVRVAGAPSAVCRHRLGGPVHRQRPDVKRPRSGCSHSPARTVPPLCRRLFALCVARWMPSCARVCAARAPVPSATDSPARRTPSGTAIAAGASYGPHLRSSSSTPLARAQVRGLSGATTARGALRDL